MVLEIKKKLKIVKNNDNFGKTRKMLFIKHVDKKLFYKKLCVQFHEIQHILV